LILDNNFTIISVGLHTLNNIIQYVTVGNIQFLLTIHLSLALSMNHEDLASLSHHSQKGVRKVVQQLTQISLISFNFSGLFVILFNT